MYLYVLRIVFVFARASPTEQLLLGQEMYEQKRADE